MLGIRRYGGAAIDLFQGELALFAVDLVVPPTLAGLQSGDRQRARHVAVDAAQLGEQGQQAVMTLLKAFLSEPRQEATVRRITLVTPNGDAYAALQEELFRTFPDEED